MTAGEWASLDVSEYVTDTLSRGATDFGLALGGAADSGATWQRLVGGDDGMGAEYGPRLVVTWSGLRPTALESIEGTDPQLLGWSLPAIAGEQQRFQVQVSHDAFATADFESATIKGKAGRAMAFTMPRRRADPGRGLRLARARQDRR